MAKASSYDETVRVLEGALLNARVDTGEAGALEQWQLWLRENAGPRAKAASAVRIYARQVVLGHK